MHPRSVMFFLVLVGCADPVRPESPATSSAAADDAPEGERRTITDREHMQYRSRVRSFLKEGFAVQGLGLSADELKLLRAEASCQLDAAGVVVACTTTKATGNAKFDAAVSAALEAKKGKQTPPPPADKPDWHAAEITMSLRCGPNCN